MREPAGQRDEPPPSVSAEWLASALSEHQRWLRTVLAARGVERHALDDAMQNVAAAAIRGADRLREPNKLPAWLYRLAIVEALQYRRHTGRRRRLVERYADSGVAADETEIHDPLAWLLAEEEQQLVRRAIAGLAPRDAEMLLLRYTEDWSYRQLAERLGMSVGAVEARLHRARGRLRSALLRLAPGLVTQH